MIKHRWVLLIISLVMSFYALTSFAVTTLTPLPIDEAFQISATANSPTNIEATLKIAPGYYLYVNRTQIALQPETAADIQYPKGESRYDQDRGHYAVYSGNVTIPITLKSATSPLQLNVHYQGCAQDGFCYPPSEKNISLNLPANGANNSTSASGTSLISLLTNQYSINQLLASQRITFLLLSFLGLGILLAFTPCVFPMVPILVAIIVGQKNFASHKRAFMLSLTYILGMAFTYALAGMLVAYLGKSLQIVLQQPIFIITGAILFVLLALTLFEYYELPFAKRLQNLAVAFGLHHQGGSYVNVFMMAVMSTLIISPCVTAPLIGVLMYIANTGDVLLGASALFVMGIGMGIPLLLVGVSAGKWLPKSGPWMQAVVKTFGFMMLAMAIWLLSRILPHAITMTLTGLLMMGIAFSTAVYFPRWIGKPRLDHILGTLFAIAGFFVIVNAWYGSNTPNVYNNENFTIVRNISELNQQLNQAKTNQLPVLIDFYADWCESCVQMDKHVFNNPEVKKILGNYKLVRVDLTKNTKADEAMMKSLNVVAPPTVIFFNVLGKEVDAHRIVGEVNLNEFLSRMNLFMAASCDKKVEC